jgi:hypothetical protein
MLTRLDPVEEAEVARRIEERVRAPLVSGPDLAHALERLLEQSRSRSSE